CPTRLLSRGTVAHVLWATPAGRLPKALRCSGVPYGVSKTQTIVTSMLVAVSLTILTGLSYAEANDRESPENCIGINAFRCIESREAATLKKYPHLAERVGDTLTLKIQSGANLQLKDCKETYCDIYYYRLQAYFPTLNIYLVEKKTIEESAYALIHLKTGKEINIDELPLFSPDIKRFVTVNICEAHCTRRIQIWRVSKDGVKLERTLDRGWSPEKGGFWSEGSARWIDNSTIELTITSKTSLTGSSEIRETFLIKLFPEGWRIVKKK
ncbi:MAG: hypothetical protein AAB252_06385, partial [Pseudomonadota bacterium]